MNFMTVSPEALAIAKSDPMFLDFLSKDFTAGDVHVPGGDPDGKKKKKPAKPSFDELLSEAGTSSSPHKSAAELALDKMDAAHAAERAALAAMLGIDKLQGPRLLKPHADGGAHSPFPFDPQAMSRLHEDQMRRFLGALTGQDEQEDRRVGVNTLVALQPRVDPTKITSMQRTLADARVEKIDLKKPLVVRFAGKNYLADGHHRAAAMWLAGDNAIDCKYCNLGGADDELNKQEVVEWSMPIDFLKAAGDRQMIFGVASVVEENGRLVIDKQDDGIPVHELEDAVYDYVLDARGHGEMHTVDDKGSTGRLLESFMVTDEKRAAYKAAGYTLSFKNEDGEEVSGWLVGYKVDDAGTWTRCKSGDLPEFSIGGRSLRTPI